MKVIGIDALDLRAQIFARAERAVRGDVNLAIDFGHIPATAAS